MFKIYDLDNDDLISMEDLKKILNMMVGTYISETELNYMVEKTIRQADKDCDGLLDFDEFCATFSRKDIIELLRVKFD